MKWLHKACIKDMEGVRKQKINRKTCLVASSRPLISIVNYQLFSVTERPKIVGQSMLRGCKNKRGGGIGR